MIVVDPSQWSSALSATQYALSVGGSTYTVQNAGAAYSLTAPTQDTLRFEVRGGDTWSGDPSVKNRSEIGGWSLYGVDTQINVSYGFQIEPGAANTAGFLVVGQFHQSAVDNYSPPFAIDMDGERMTVSIEYKDGTGKLLSSTLYEDDHDIVRGHTYAMEIHATFDTNNHGHLVVVRDGVTLANYVGSFGYEGMGSVYWKEGVYRSASTETLAADYSHTTITTSAADLSLKATAPMVSFAPVMGFDSGISNSDFISTNGFVTIKGAASPGAQIVIKDGDTVIGQTQADGFGAWTVNKSLAVGSHTLSADATLSGLTTHFVSNQPIVVDNTKPTVAAITAITTNLGVVAAGGTSHSDQLVLSGTAEAKSIVQVFTDGSLTGSATADSTGHWTFDDSASPVSNGHHWFSAVAKDLAGNSAAWSASYNITVSDSTPTVIVTPPPVTPTPPPAPVSLTLTQVSPLAVVDSHGSTIMDILATTDAHTVASSIAASSDWAHF